MPPDPAPHDPARRAPRLDATDPGRTEESGAEVDLRQPAGALPERIGPYRVEALLGRGGMGEVYRAWDPRLERHVAVKRILPEQASPKARARFWREARALAAVRHPGLVALHDIGEDGDALYLAMELVAGRPLSETRGARWTTEAALALVADLARAVGAAHRAGIVHRDIKPSNILVEASGAARLVDFGLARKQDEDEVTASGALVGTWSWMAPEQIAGEPLTPATDVHALGALLYTLLGGEPPYSRETRETTAAAILAGARPDLASLRPDLPAAVHALIDRALARRAEHRPQDGAALAAELDALAGTLGSPHDPGLVARGFEGARAAIDAPGVATGLASRTRARAPQRTWVLAGALGLAALGVWALLAGGSDSEDTPPEATSAPVDTREARAAIADLRAAPRRTLAVLPLREVGSTPSSGLGGALAELLRRELTDGQELAVWGWRELLGRSPGGPEALSPAALLADPARPGGVDAVVTGEVRPSGDGHLITLELYATGSSTPVVTVSFEARSGALASAPSALSRAVARELGVKPPPTAPARRPNLAATMLVLEAERALHAEHWRRFRGLLERALSEAPDDPRALLLSVWLDLALDRPDAVKATLADLRARNDLTPRDASFLAYLDAAHGTIDRERAPTLLRDHLERYPYDLEARLERLRESFVAIGSGKLRRAAEAASELLAATPHAPLAASRLVRAMSWIGHPEDARARLAELGLGPDTPDHAAVFAELAMYEGDFDGARTLFEQSREPDGDLTYYAANMRVAAGLLAGRCWEGFSETLALVRNAGGRDRVFGIDWTYFLGVQGLTCDGRVGEAIEALRSWSRATGTSAGLRYAPYLSGLEALARPDPEALAEELIASEAGLHPLHLHILIAHASDRTTLAPYLGRLRSDLVGDLGAPGHRLGARARLIEGLEARLALLEGRVGEALETLARLARPGGFEVESEGDLFERLRWQADYAENLEDAGLVDAAIEAWREVLDRGYDRLLAMDVSLRARQRLDALGAAHR